MGSVDVRGELRAIAHRFGTGAGEVNLPGDADALACFLLGIEPDCELLEAQVKTLLYPEEFELFDSPLSVRVWDQTRQLWLLVQPGEWVIRLHGPGGHLLVTSDLVVQHLFDLDDGDADAD